MYALKSVMKRLRHVETAWHRHQFSGQHFSETVEVFLLRSYGAHPMQTIDIFRPRTRQSAPLVILLPGLYFCALEQPYLQEQIKTLTTHGYAVALIRHRVAPEYLYATQLLDLSLALRFLALHKDSFHFETGFFLHGFNSGANLMLNYLNGLEHQYIAQEFELKTELDLSLIRGCALSDGIYDLDTPPFASRAWRPSLALLFLGKKDHHAIRSLASPTQHLASQLPPMLITTKPRSALIPQFLELKRVLGRHTSASNDSSIRRFQYLISNDHQSMDFFERIRHQAKVLRMQPLDPFEKAL